MKIRLPKSSLLAGCRHANNQLIDKRRKNQIRIRIMRALWPVSATRVLGDTTYESGKECLRQYWLELQGEMSCMENPREGNSGPGNQRGHRKAGVKGEQLLKTK